MREARAVYEDLGGYDESLRISADYEFVYRCRRDGRRFLRLREVLVNMHLGGTAGRNRVTARRETRDVALRHGAPAGIPWAAYLLRRMLRR